MSILLWPSTSADVAGGYLSLLFYNTVNVYLETALYVQSNFWAQIYTWSVFKCSSDSKRVGVLLKYLTSTLKHFTAVGVIEPMLKNQQKIEGVYDNKFS